MICPACDHDNIAGADLCMSCGMDLAGLDVQAWGVNPQDPVLARELQQLALKEPLTVPIGTVVTEVIELMKDRREGCVFVLDRGKLAGVVTERDISSKVAAPGRVPDTTMVEDVMTPRPVTLQKGDAFAWALHRMGVDGHRHLPVLDGDRLTGFLSMRTVLRTLLEA